MEVLQRDWFRCLRLGWLDFLCGIGVASAAHDTEVLGSFSLTQLSITPLSQCKGGCPFALVPSQLSSPRLSVFLIQLLLGLLLVIDLNAIRYELTCHSFQFQLY